MPNIDTTLLDLNRAPTLDELKAFFKKHDWSSAEIQIDGKKNQETLKDIAHIKKILDEKFEKAARDKGLPAWSGYFENKINPSGNASHQGNSLLELRDNTEKLISKGSFAKYEQKGFNGVAKMIIVQFTKYKPYTIIYVTLFDWLERRIYESVK